MVGMSADVGMLEADDEVPSPPEVELVEDVVLCGSKS